MVTFLFISWVYTLSVLVILKVLWNAVQSPQQSLFESPSKLSINQGPFSGYFWPMGTIPLRKKKNFQYQKRSKTEPEGCNWEVYTKQSWFGLVWRERPLFGPKFWLFHVSCVKYVIFNNSNNFFFWKYCLIIEVYKQIHWLNFLNLMFSLMVLLPICLYFGSDRYFVRYLTTINIVICSFSNVWCKVLVHFYSILLSTTLAQLQTTKLHPSSTKNCSSTTKYYSSTAKYFSRITAYYKVLFQCY